jgi:hypothetical protein
VLFIGCKRLHAQSLPYLNASAGNSYEAVRGLDSSMYVYQRDTLYKINKNLSVVWAKQYTGVSFTNLLLSKTGSLFFVTANRFGKINAATGQLVWMKSISQLTVNTGTATNTCVFNPKQILLDHNNHIVISGLPQFGLIGSGGIFVKADTSGNIVNARFLNNNMVAGFFNIVTDSSGIYSFFTDFTTVGGPAVGLLFYNSQTDSYMRFSGVQSIHPNPPQFYSSGAGSFKKSLRRDIFYFNFWNTYMVNNVFSSYTGVYSVNGVLGVNLGLPRITEGEHHSLTANYGSAYIQLDSNYNLITGANFPTSIHGVFPFYSGKTMFGFNLNTPQTNTLTLTGTGTLTPCTQTYSTSFYAGPPTPYYNVSMTCSVYPVTISVSTVSASVIPVNIILQQNYCAIIAGVSDLLSNEASTFEIYPNPFNDLITLKGKFYQAQTLRLSNVIGETIQLIEVTADSESAVVDLGALKPGIYYLSMGAQGSKLVKKIIKL